MQFEDSAQQAITRLDISSYQPGSLLHDFRLFLQAVAEKPVILSRTKQLPPPKWAQTLAIIIKAGKAILLGAVDVCSCAQEEYSE